MVKRIKFGNVNHSQSANGRCATPRLRSPALCFAEPTRQCAS